MRKMCNEGILLCSNLREIPVAGGSCSQQQLRRGLSLPASCQHTWGHLLLSPEQRWDCVRNAALQTVAQMGTIHLPVVLLLKKTKRWNAVNWEVLTESQHRNNMGSVVELSAKIRKSGLFSYF